LERRIAIQEIYERTDCLGEVFDMYENNQLEVSNIDNFYVGMSLIFTDMGDYHIPEVSGRVVIAVDKDKRRITVDGSDITDLMPSGGNIYVHESGSALHSIKQKLSEFETNFDNIEERFDNVVNLRGNPQNIYGSKIFHNTVFVKDGIDARDDKDNTVIYEADGINYHGVLWSGHLTFPPKDGGVFTIATTDDIDTAIGNINSILDAINGEVI
jgi:hypothetical protein